MHVIRTHEPPWDELDVVLLARQHFVLCVRTCEPMVVSPGDKVCFGSEAFEEDATLCKQVDELIDCGALEWVRHGGTVN
jgi:hypothetical protein